MVSDLCNNFQNESDSSTTDPTSFCAAYDDGMDLKIDFRDISLTLIPLSESEYPSFFTEKYSQISESVFDNSNNNIESQVSHYFDQITTKNMLLPSIIHNSLPRPAVSGRARRAMHAGGAFRGAANQTIID
ncbi:hypothetical protein HHI36_022410 [Cryptolaemus montrouzieri]|uniref:Uncharacterized protein n=1 Tax=Cryptolaemus montrouzieri TaxID=559131 RepID=A0ABD2N0H3_9CUCU